MLPRLQPWWCACCARTTTGARSRRHRARSSTATTRRRRCGTCCVRRWCRPDALPRAIGPAAAAVTGSRWVPGVRQCLLLAGCCPENSSIVQQLRAQPAAVAQAGYTSTTVAADGIEFAIEAREGVELEPEV